MNKDLFIQLSTILFTSFFFINADCQPLQGYDRCNQVKTENSIQFENWLSTKTNPSARTSEVHQIPVVVHIIHNGESIGEGTNISSEQIASQIRVLNEDFRRKEGTRGFNDHPNGEDAGIEFIMAKSSPEGKTTDGIVRVDINQFTRPSFGGNMVALGAYYSIWNPHQYLNIWAFPGIQDFGLGEARFPISDLPGLDEENNFVIPGIDFLHGVPVNDIDGVAINTIHFGEVEINSNYHLGRTGTHEIGHFLGLYHTWGDEGFEGSCDIDDYCGDTPNVSSRTIGCPLNKLACDGLKAMIENYMDYTNDECMNIFTSDQVFRMRTVLENSPRRKSLLTSKGLLPPNKVVGIPNLEKVKPNIYPNPYQDDIYIDIPDEQSWSNLEVQFYDLTGSLVSDSLLTDINHSNVIRLTPPSKNPRSIFIVKLIFEKQVLSYRVVEK